MIILQRFRCLVVFLGGVLTSYLISMPTPAIAMDFFDCTDGTYYLGAAADKLQMAEDLSFRSPGDAIAAFIEGEHLYNFAGGWDYCFEGAERVKAEVVAFEERFLRMNYAIDPDQVLDDASYMRFIREKMKADKVDIQYPLYWSRIERYESYVAEVAQLLQLMKAKYAPRG